jgi:hypothetical protein
MERIESNREILDPGAGVRVVCAHHVEVALEKNRELVHKWRESCS